MPSGKSLLTPIQTDFLRHFSGLPDQGQFHLAGGTALAEFFLGHRLSFDLDLFTSAADLILPFSHRLEAVRPPAGVDVRVVRRFSTYVELSVSRTDEQLRVELAQDTPVRFAQPFLSEYGVWVSDYQDLIVEKLLAFYGRAEPRDAVDLHFILRHESLDALLDLAPEKDAGFDLYWMAVALDRAAGFPEEADRWPVEMLESFEPAALKAQFRQLAMDLMSRVAPSEGIPASPE